MIGSESVSLRRAACLERLLGNQWTEGYDEASARVRLDANPAAFLSRSRVKIQY